ncbi:S-methyl-5-thioribose kinase [Ammoniphilus oxalaticus]|uniref:S-methyl-5-thioribose kinase n=1 Tax=Ammoniphilus oxalaticus TaxID=66863 RepID=A0A419SJ23_9BACL|nr:S-methyl-5-thioribose kinase [Ammoniphilus oxalaticus]RKD24021.1 S-methyl-5-thioribose kinase [Ammoniphilus oxalaticus]
MEALIVQHTVCPSLVPQVFHYNAELALIVMEDLPSFQILRQGLIELNRYSALPKHLGQFLAKMLFYTSRFGLEEEERTAKRVQFINPELSHMTGGVVFTDPFQDAEMNQFNPLIREQVTEIWEKRALQLEVAKLKDHFFTHAQALVHGDLHTGSIMVREGETKIVDPEFAFYGPIGFDIGAIIGNILLNYASHEGYTDQSQARAEYQQYLLETIRQLWIEFEREFATLCREESKEASVLNLDYLNNILVRVLQDTLGFAGCKMLRRVIGISRVADLEGIEDERRRAKAEVLVLELGARLIVQRQAVTSVDGLVNIIVSSKKM